MILVKVTAHLANGTKVINISHVSSCKVARDNLAVAYPTITTMKATKL